MVERAYSVTPVRLSVSIHVQHYQIVFKYFRRGCPHPLDTFLVCFSFTAVAKLILYIAPDKRGIQWLFFWFLHKNICCGYSLEAPLWGTSNEYPQHVFCAGIRKILVFCWWKKKRFIWSYVCRYSLALPQYNYHLIWSYDKGDSEKNFFFFFFFFIQKYWYFFSSFFLHTNTTDDMSVCLVYLVVLQLSMLGKNFNGWHSEIFFLFFPENKIWQVMKIVTIGDRLHAISNPIFCVSADSRRTVVSFWWKNVHNTG